MRKTKIAKLIAASTAATMLLAPAAVFAADGDVTDPGAASSGVNGDGSLEGFVNKDVFCVVLPTIQNINFTLDPQGLLNKANSTKYTLKEGAVYFENDPAQGSSDPTYSGTSKEIAILNKSSYDVEVGLSVTLNTGDITLAAKDAVAAATKPSLYLGLITDGGTAVAIDKAAYESTAATVDAVPEVGADDGSGGKVSNGYELQGSATKVEGAVESPNGFYYTYGLSSNFTNADADKVVYKLEGTCDTKGDWSGIDTKAVTANVAWTITKAGAPSITGKAYSIQNTANTYTMKNVTEEIKSISISTDGKTPALSVPAAAYSVDSGKTTLTIDGSKAGIGQGGVGQVRYFIVTFADDSTAVFSVNVSA